MANPAFAGPLVPLDYLTGRDGCCAFEAAYSADMLIHPILLDGVAFMYRTRQEAERRAKLGGSGFMVGKLIEGSNEAVGRDLYVPYLVSNRHVVLEGSACVATVNVKSGGAPDIWDIDQNDWVPHPAGDDVAVACVQGRMNMAIHKVSHIQSWRFLTPEKMAEYEVGIGEEVFMVGRFINHQGRATNEAAVRFGSISVMNSPIRNSIAKRDQESFAVEMRSRTGFSGSPVMVYRTPATVLTDVPPGKGNFDFLLGVNWGYGKSRRKTKAPT